MKKRAIIVFIMLIAGPAAASPACNLKNLGECRDTNQLIWADGVDAAIHAFIGQERGNFLYQKPRVTAADDAIEVLSGPPDEPVTLEGGLKFFTACRGHSCPEKGGIVLQPDGKSWRSESCITFVESSLPQENFIAKTMQH